MDKNRLNTLFHAGSCIPEPELEQYAKGTIEGISANKIERHLVDCDACSDTVEGLELYYAAAQNKVIPLITDDERETGRDEVIPIHTGKNFKKIFAYAASALILVTLGALSLKFLGDIKDKEEGLAVVNNKPLEEVNDVIVPDTVLEEISETESPTSNQKMPKTGVEKEPGLGKTEQIKQPIAINDGYLAAKNANGNQQENKEKEDVMLGTDPSNDGSNVVDMDLKFNSNLNTVSTNEGQSEPTSAWTSNNSTNMPNDPITYTIEEESEITEKSVEVIGDKAEALAEAQAREMAEENSKAVLTAPANSHTEIDDVTIQNSFESTGAIDDLKDRKKTRLRKAKLKDSGFDDEVVLDSMSDSILTTDLVQLNFKNARLEGDQFLISGALNGMTNESFDVDFDNAHLNGFLIEEGTGTKTEVNLMFTDDKLSGLAGNRTLNYKSMLPVYLSFKKDGLGLNDNSFYKLHVNIDQGFIIPPKGVQLKLMSSKPIRIGLK